MFEHSVTLPPVCYALDVQMICILASAIISFELDLFLFMIFFSCWG